MGHRWADGYSSDVEIFLVVDGERLAVAQLGHGSLILREPAPLPAGTHAQLVIRIDGVEETADVVLDAGAALNEQPVYFEQTMSH